MADLWSKKDSTDLLRAFLRAVLVCSGKDLAYLAGSG